MHCGAKQLARPVLPILLKNMLYCLICLNSVAVISFQITDTNLLAGMWKRKRKLEAEVVLFLWKRKREKSTASAST